MNFEEQHIDNLFKDALEGEKVTFEPSAWEQVEGLISSKRKKKVVGWKLASLVGLAIIAGVLLYNRAVNEVSTKQETAALASGNDKNMQPTPVEMVNETPAVADMVTNQNAGQTTLSTTDHLPTPSAKARSYMAKTSEQPEHNSNDVNTTKEKVPNLTHKEDASSEPHKQESGASPFRWPEPILYQRTNTLQLVKGSEPVPQPIYLSMPIRIVSPDSIEQPDSQGRAKSNKLKVGVETYGGVGLANNEKLKAEIGDYFLETIPQNSLFYGGGIRLDYGRLSVSIGAQQQTYKQITGVEGYIYTTEYDTTLTIISKEYDIDGKLYWLVEEKIDSTDVRTEVIENKAGGETRSKQLQIPLNLDYGFRLTPKLMARTGLGIRFNQVKSTSGLYFDPITGESAHIDIKPVWSSSWLATASLEYQWIPRFSTSIRMDYLPRVQQHNAFGRSFTTGRLNTGIRLTYRLN
ncbi:MAG: hypothetical protein JJ975_06245 [Bacteroidia bacterium]|nr:hypothetical protein [Bacteroidia bacterium]